mgnify:FL=1
MGNRFNVQAGNYVGIVRYNELYVMRTRYIDGRDGEWLMDGDGPSGPFNWRQRSDGGELKFVLLAEEIGEVDALVAEASALDAAAAKKNREADDEAMLYSYDSMDNPDRYEAAAAKAEEAWIASVAARRYRNFLLGAQRGVKGEW